MLCWKRNALVHPITWLRRVCRTVCVFGFEMHWFDIFCKFARICKEYGNPTAVRATGWQSYTVVLMCTTSVHAYLALHWDALEPFLTYRGRRISWVPLTQVHRRCLWPLPLIWMQMIACLNIYLCASASKSASVDLNCWFAAELRVFQGEGGGKMTCEGRQIWRRHCKHGFERWLKLNVTCHFLWIFFFFAKTNKDLLHQDEKYAMPW